MSDQKEELQEEEVSQSEGGKSKTRKKFEVAMNSLTLILGGQALYKPTSLVPEEVQNAVKELAKEEKEKFIKDFKTKAITLIQKKREHDKEVKKIYQEAAQKEEKNMEGFIKEANDLFAMAKDIQKIEKDYYDTFIGAAEGKSAAPETK